MSATGSIVILTGAGISAESGLATFRGPDGLWEGHRVEDVCTPEALARDEATVQRFYDERRAALAQVVPNPAHAALARLDRAWPGALLIVTQNVDDLHERARRRGGCCTCMASSGGRCAARAMRGPSGTRTWGMGRPVRPAGVAGALRPDIVFFGEMPYGMARIEAALQACDLFVSIGTSGAVYPAAGFVQLASACGAATLELNLEPSAGSTLFDDSRLGPAGRLVPAWVDEVLAAA